MRPLGLAITMMGAVACGPSVVFDDGPGGSASIIDPEDGSGGATEGSGAGGSATVGEGGGPSTGSAVSTSSGAGGTSSTSVSTSSGVGGAPSTASVGGGGAEPCKSCSMALSGAPGPLCPWSAPLFDAVVQCGCVNHCAIECVQACNGMSGGPSCEACLYQNCIAEIDACWQD